MTVTHWTKIKFILSKKNQDSSNWYDENTTCCSTTSGPRHLEKLRARQQQDVNKRYTSSSFLTEDEKDIFDKVYTF